MSEWTDELYIMGIDHESCRGIVKIGRSDNTRKRLSNLQASCPFLVRVLHIEPEAGKYERGLHHFFRSQHMRGEWFDLSETFDPVKEVISALEQLKSRGDYRPPAKKRGRPSVHEAQLRAALQC